MNASTCLEALLDATLNPQGFARLRRGSTWYRPVDGIDQIVGLRHSRSGNGTAVWFGAERAGNALGAMHELSPVAPLSNTWWWPSPLDAADAESLAAQLRHIVLPYFTAMPPAPAQAEQAVVSALRPLAALDPPFAAEGLVHWRRRGAVIDLVVPELLADACFVRVWFAVWHDTLTGGLSGEPPAGVTLAASHPFGRDGLDGDPLLALYLTRDGAGAPALDGAQIAAGATAWFAGLMSADDVRAQIRPEYRRHFDEQR